MEKESVSVGVCIVHYDAREELNRCLRSFEDHPPKVPYRIVVADNSSTLFSIREVVSRFQEITLLEMEGNCGFSRACNRAARETDATYLFFLNPDARIGAGALDSMVEFLESHRDYAVLGPLNLGPDGEVQQSCRRFPTYKTAIAHRYSLLTRLFPNNLISRDYLMSSLDRTRPQDVDWVSGAAMMVRREDFEVENGFDEDFWMYAEDVDLCYRMQQRGRKVGYYPLATIVHEIGCSSRRNRFRALWERHRSMYTFYKKHYSLEIPLIDFMTLFGIVLRGVVFLGLEAMGRSPHR